MKSHNYFQHAISVCAAVSFLTFFSQTVSDSSGKSLIARQVGKMPTIRRSKVAQPLGVPNGSSETNTSKSLKMANLKEVIHTPSGTSAAKFAEVEITLNEVFPIEYVSVLPKAPSSDVQILDGGKRVKVQLPADLAQALIDRGAEISVLRNFVLVEVFKGKATKEDGGVTTVTTCSGSDCYGENDANVYIPDDDDWVYSLIPIACAPACTPVNCIDVHYEITHSHVGDLDVDLTDEDYTSYEYHLWENEGGGAVNIDETVTGIKAFNGKNVNQMWLLWAKDTDFLVSGEIDYWWIKVYYDPDDVISPPPHNDCSAAIPVLEGEPYMGSTCGATGVYESSCSSYDYPDVWHSYMPASTGLVTISLAGSSFDTTLAVFDECDGIELACDDDLCNSPESEITVLMTGGTTYLIRVAGYIGAGGDYTLTVTDGPRILPPEPNSPSPANGQTGVPLDAVLSWNTTHGETSRPKSSKAAITLPRTTVTPKVIYGEDDRLEEYEVKDADILTVGDSTAALVCLSDLTYNGDGKASLPDDTFAQWYIELDGNSLCDDEPFLDQPNPAFCSGFLVAPDIVATAGHCLLWHNCSLDTCLDADCCAADIAIVFGFVMSDANTPVLTIPESEIYYCTEVILNKGEGSADCALIRLDREVTGHTPLRVRHTGIVPDGERLLVIGHPVGLPRKYAGGARVRDNNEPAYFQANLDTYDGNSGSPVFNANTLQVEGILVRGQDDFTWDDFNKCDRSNVCPDEIGCYDWEMCPETGCPGWESVTRATEFSDAIPSFDVYLGTDCNELSLICPNSVVPWRDPGPLERQTTYHWRVVAKNPCGQTESVCWSFTTEDIIDVDLTLDYPWMYQNLPEKTDSTVRADAVIVDDPLNNMTYGYKWEFILPSDVSVGPMPIDGCGATDAYCTFAACGCDEPNAISKSGQPIGIRVTVTGNDHGNTAAAEAELGIALLGDVNNDCLVDLADRSIINAFWKTGSAAGCSLRDCDLNCDRIVDVADRSIANAIWKGILGHNSAGNPCLFRSLPPRR